MTASLTHALRALVGCWLTTALVVAHGCGTARPRRPSDVLAAFSDAVAQRTTGCDALRAIEDERRATPTEVECLRARAGELRISLVVRPLATDEPAGLEGLAAVLTAVALEGEVRGPDGERVPIQRAALTAGMRLERVTGADGVGWAATLPEGAPVAMIEAAALTLVALAAEPSYGSNLLATWTERHRAGAAVGQALPEAWRRPWRLGMGGSSAPLPSRRRSPR